MSAALDGAASVPAASVAPFLLSVSPPEAVHVPSAVSALIPVPPPPVVGAWQPATNSISIHVAEQAMV